MNFFRYIERKYANAAANLSKEFTLSDDATAKASKQWSDNIRSFCKWVTLFKLIGEYWLYRLGFVEEPIDIIAKAKADMAIAKAQANEKSAVNNGEVLPET